MHDEWTLQPPKRRSFPRLPWKRGPAAWTVACRASEVMEAIHRSPRGYFSLRQSARLVGLSTEPLRDAIQRNFLKRDGPRKQISKQELCRFVSWLEERALPYDALKYLERIHRNQRNRRYDFKKLRTAEFVWPRERKALTPAELAKLIGCHSSLIVKAIRHLSYWRLGHRPTPCRWAITLRAWTNCFIWCKVTISPKSKKSVSR